ncbi:citrate synthase [Povalibacter uvarum]|uniref:Citrate synthase n=1 Tax=Povalibacter uvarum TaxID=732238 RepID=A0A841HJK8_9GAMM|nr:citrate/2-methylcitrate synthase [Povalibacter uvarum]MBB6093227.1 citrate synthase [Povalibacter uvarum]
MTASAEVHKGLEGVIADTTSTSLVDGEAGALYYRGYPIESLVNYRFAEVMHLVVFGDLPDPRRLNEVEDYLWHAGRLPAEVAATLRVLARNGAHPMVTLQAIAPILALEPPAQRLGRTDEEEEGLLVAARIPAALALINAALEDHPEPAYPVSRRYGERYLQLLTGKLPSAEAVEAFEVMQVLQLDHGFNASTFTARVVTSTLAPPASALAAAMGALYGPLHGAADQGALEMAMEVGEPQHARAFVTQCLATGRKVLGMGHREYRVVDPRAKILKAMAERSATEFTNRRLLNTLSAVEAAFVEQTSAKRRALRANMEFYKGVLCLSLGIAKEYFTATFAASRAFGWLAHIVEQRQDNRIIRPAALYVGPAPREPGARQKVG